jgi:hypothetical protein
MKSLLTVLSLGLSLSSAPLVRAQTVEPLASERVQPLGMPGATDHEPAATITAPLTPAGDGAKARATFSYVRNGLGGGGGTFLPGDMEGLRLELYPLSWRRLRAGVEVEAGHGHGTSLGAGTSTSYGLLGVKLGLKVPRGVTPFVSGRVTSGSVRPGALMIPGTPITVGGSGAPSGMSSRGVDIGIDVMKFGGGSLSLALGYTRTTWQFADYARNTMVFKQSSTDGFLLKVGITF